MNEEECRKLAEEHGYKWIGIKRFKTHDRIAVITPTGDCTLRLTLKKHVEDLPLEFAKEWFR